MSTFSPSDEASVRALYQNLLDAWNRRSAEDMAALFVEDGSQVGFDGSTVEGRGEIERHLAPIFASHPTPGFVGKVRGVRSLGPEAALLQAAAGMVPEGAQELKPELNAIQGLVAVRTGQGWRVAHFQNTPAAFHGRPELRESLTAELEETRRTVKAGSRD